MAINTETALSMVKARLNRVEGDTTLDSYLTARIEAAVGAIEGMGIQPRDDNAEDLMDVVDLAVYNYQNRDKAEATPEWLRARLRNRWLRQVSLSDDS